MHQATAVASPEAASALSLPCPESPGLAAASTLLLHCRVSRALSRLCLGVASACSEPLAAAAAVPFRETVPQSHWPSPPIASYSTSPRCAGSYQPFIPALRCLSCSAVFSQWPHRASLVRAALEVSPSPGFCTSCGEPPLISTRPYYISLALSRHSSGLRFFASCSLPNRRRPASRPAWRAAGHRVLLLLHFLLVCYSYFAGRPLCPLLCS